MDSLHWFNRVAGSEYSRFDMKAGRELDLRVGRIVFGIKRFYHNEQNIIWFVDGKERKMLPFYSTKRSDGFLVIDELSPNHYQIDFTDNVLDKFHCIISVRPSVFSAFGTSIAHAICLTALDARRKK